jgi:hypothetical protein
MTITITYGSDPPTSIESTVAVAGAPRRNLAAEYAAMAADPAWVADVRAFLEDAAASDQEVLTQAEGHS